MRCFYINLDRAQGRRDALEQRFAACAPPGWNLTRVAAVGPKEAALRSCAFAPGVIGCYLSHVKALSAALDVDGDVLILEDDATFSQRSLEVLSHLTAQPGSWDLLFTDLTLFDIGRYLRLVKQWDGLVREGRFLIEDMAGANFIGSTAYVVRDASKRRLVEAISGSDVTLPIDAKLGELIRAGSISGAYCVPHLTTISADADRSQISDPRDGEALLHRSLNAMRRLMYLDHDLNACACEGAALADALSPHARLCGVALAAILTA